MEIVNTICAVIGALAILIQGLIKIIKIIKKKPSKNKKTKKKLTITIVIELED